MFDGILDAWFRFVTTGQGDLKWVHMGGRRTIVAWGGGTTINAFLEGDINSNEADAAPLVPLRTSRLIRCSGSSDWVVSGSATSTGGLLIRESGTDANQTGAGWGYVVGRAKATTGGLHFAMSDFDVRVDASGQFRYAVLANPGEFTSYNLAIYVRAYLEEL